MVIPIFPLELVLLPGEPQQLRIFEPRYRQMLDDCMLDHKPFGVCLINPFEPVKEWPGPHWTGTTARITHHEEQGANHFIEIQGQRRFRIIRIIEPLLPPHDKSIFDADEVTQRVVSEELIQPDLHELLDRVDEEERKDGRLYLRAEVELLPELKGELTLVEQVSMLQMWANFLDAMGKGIGLPDEILEDWTMAQRASVAEADAGSLWRIGSVLLHDTWARQALLEVEHLDEALEEILSNLIEPTPP